MVSSASNGNLWKYIGVLFVALSLNFLLPRWMPGNPLLLVAGVDAGQLTAEEQAEFLAELGLDRPLHEQYLSYMGDTLRGDLGYSYREQRPIVDILQERLPWTLFITLSSLVFSALIGVLLGTLSAWWQGKASDLALLNGMVALDGLPAFWIGMLLIALLAVNYNVFPSQGAVTPASGYEGLAYWWDVLQHATLPIFTLSLISLPRIYLTTRYTMIDLTGDDFIRTAYSKGLSRNYVLLRHIVPNVLIPVVTVLALRLGFAFGGTVVIETVFSYPGVGRLIFEAVNGRDYPVMQATFLIFTIAVLASNLLADLLYPLLDPRVRRAG